MYTRPMVSFSHWPSSRRSAVRILVFFLSLAVIVLFGMSAFTNQNIMGSLASNSGYKRRFSSIVRGNVVKDKKSFLKEYYRDSSAYGYGENNHLFQRYAGDGLVGRFEGVAYLDWTASGLYTSQQLDTVMKRLKSTAFGNPHSLSAPSMASTNMIETTREKVLDYLHTNSEDYTVIFTSGATGGLKLVGELFSWKSCSQFDYLRVNHNSVVGIRELVKKAGASFHSRTGIADLKSTDCPSLFAFPPGDNFAGVHYPLEWVKSLQDSGWSVLLDAAAYVPTQPLNLTQFPADFAVISFYKMFGYPTGLGALLVRNSILPLNKVYFGGGTMQVVDADSNYAVLRPCSAPRYEDGTLSFLSIAAVDAGMNQVLGLGGLAAVSVHVDGLVHYIRHELSSMRHANGNTVAVMYGERSGSIVAFNLKNAEGDWIGHYSVQRKAKQHAIVLRTGCHCNPGACQQYCDFSSDDVVSKIPIDMDSCSEAPDIIDGRPFGAVRVSVGYLTTFEEVWTFIKFIEGYYRT